MGGDARGVVPEPVAHLTIAVARVRWQGGQRVRTLDNDSAPDETVQPADVPVLAEEANRYVLELQIGGELPVRILELLFRMR